MGVQMDIEEYDQVLQELFKCRLKPSVKCELCDEDINNSDAKGLSLCVYGKINKSILKCIQSIIEKHNLKYMQIKGEGEKALKIYTPK